MVVMFLMVCDKIMVKPVKGIQLRIITYALNCLFSNELTFNEVLQPDFV